MSKSKISRKEMARRVEAAAEQGSEEAPVATEASPVTVGVWQGLTNYVCGMCAYATLDAEGMAGHLRAAHGWREKIVISGQWPVVSEEAEAAAAVDDREIKKDEVK